MARARAAPTGTLKNDLNEFAADPASRNEAERARDRLIAIGIPAEDIRISVGASTGRDGRRRAASREFLGLAVRA